MNVFVSLPMHGRTEEEIFKERDWCVREFRKTLELSDDTQIYVLNNITHINVPEDAGRIWHLGESIKEMDKADWIIFHPEFNSARGCRVEREVYYNYYSTKLFGAVFLSYEAGNSVVSPPLPKEWFEDV